ncbi:MAG: mitochondrial fission ELM1 family protein [Alphaproteobacteria bacterium]|nr:mitochondrial fission ELM1 family protein [Alphaproteobacteria bacterium]
MDKPVITAWVVSDGRPGHENQSLGLAEAVGAEPRLLRLADPGLRRLLPPRLWPWPLQLLIEAPLSGPWPDLVIGCGRRTGAVVAALRRRSGGRCRAVQILRSGLPARAFDLTIQPAHDRPADPGCLVIAAALHRITPARLADAAAATPVARPPGAGPDVALLIGAPTPADAERIAELGLHLARDENARLLIACSRRTGDAARAILRARLGHAPHILALTGETGPYLAFLAHADHLLVTGDSVSMAAEAVATGKPVSLLPLAATRPKISRFHAELVRRGAARLHAGPLERFVSASLDDMARAEAAVRALLARD